MRLRPPPKKPDPLEQLLLQSDFDTIPVSIITHCQAAPLGVLVRGLMEWFLDDATLERIFHEHATDQYTRELTIAALVGLMTQVSAGLRPSVYSAYKADRATPTPTISTTYQAVYGKLGRMNPEATAALVRFSSERLQPLLDLLPAASEELAGYRLRILDGNVLTGTDHRLKPLRQLLNACLPGKSLVVYEPVSGLVTDLVLCADAYSQERALLLDLLPRVREKDLIVADRNFCTTRFVFGVAAKQGFFLVREHACNVPWEAVSRLKKCGTTATGEVYEQTVRVTDPETKTTLELRRIEVRLFEKTRDGERTIALLTNLPRECSALQLADLYRRRWTIETHFQFLTESLHCEVAGLGKPRAALFMFAMALVAGNALAVVRASLRQAQGCEAAAEVSGYYLANEMAASFRAVNMYAAALDWTGWRQLRPQPLVQLLTAIAYNVNMALLTRAKRGPKKPPAEKPTYDKKHKHFSTARILDDSC
jgi:Transposase DDE domain